MPLPPSTGTWAPTPSGAGRRGHLVWLPLGPVLEPLEDALVALDDPVLLNGGLLHLGSCDGHAEANLQHPSPWSHKEPSITCQAGAGQLPGGGGTRPGGHKWAGGLEHSSPERERCGLWPGAREVWAAEFRHGLGGGGGEGVRPWTLSPTGPYLSSWLLFSTSYPCLLR